MRFPRNLASFHGYRRQSHLIYVLNQHPRGTLIADQRRACAARPKGKYSRGRMALAPIRARRIFPATGGGWPGPLPVFIQLTFTSQTGSLFLSLYAPRYCLTASAGFGRQFAKLRALSRLRRRYDSRKKRNPFVPPRLPHSLIGPEAACTSF